MDTFNGWTNWYTWCTYNWITNDFNLYEKWKRYCRGLSVNEIATALQDDMTQTAYNMTGETGLFCDLLQGAISDINFNEIAVSLKGD